jgi:hypothetical protein
MRLRHGESPLSTWIWSTRNSSRATRACRSANPGVNKQKKVSHGNYLWISYFWSYLNSTGRAGFVMSSQASTDGHGEKDVREAIIATGDVDVMISIRSNFFYTRTVPCELWFFDGGKPSERRDQILMRCACGSARSLQPPRRYGSEILRDRCRKAGAGGRRCSRAIRGGLAV